MPKFVACRRRNVAAAYRRFLGPSAVLPDPWLARTWAGMKSLKKLFRPRLATPRVAADETAAGCEPEQLT